MRVIKSKKSCCYIYILAFFYLYTVWSKNQLWVNGIVFNDPNVCVFQG